MKSRNLQKEREHYERILGQFSEAEKERTKKHFRAVATQDPKGCDTGKKIEPVFDEDTDQ